MEFIWGMLGREKSTPPLRPAETRMLNPSFMRFRLDYLQGKENQAKEILRVVREETNPPHNYPMVGITYSANDRQVIYIRNAYDRYSNRYSNGISGIEGAHQAAVMQEVEKLLQQPEYADLVGKFRILPITTVYYETYKGDPYEVADRQNRLLVDDFRNIDDFIARGGLVLGWQNQDTPQDQYAIGGGTQHLSVIINAAIQGALSGYAGEQTGPQAYGVAEMLGVRAAPPPRHEKEQDPYPH